MAIKCIIGQVIRRYALVSFGIGQFYIETYLFGVSTVRRGNDELQYTGIGIAFHADERRMLIGSNSSGLRTLIGLDHVQYHALFITAMIFNSRYRNVFKPSILIIAYV